MESYTCGGITDHSNDGDREVYKTIYRAQCPVCGMPIATYESQEYADKLIQLHMKGEKSGL